MIHLSVGSEKYTVDLGTRECSAIGPIGEAFHLEILPIDDIPELRPEKIGLLPAVPQGSYDELLQLSHAVFSETVLVDPRLTGLELEKQSSW